MQLNLTLLAFNKNFLFLDEGAFRDKYVQITLDHCLTGEACTFIQFIFGKKLQIFLPVKFCFSALDIDNTLTAFSLSSADNINVESCFLCSFKDGAATCYVNFAITRKKCYRAQDNLSLLLSLVREIRNILR